MKTITIPGFTVFLMLFVRVYAVGQYEVWTFSGCEGETVNTILPLDDGYGEASIIVGTDSGISHYAYGYWQKDIIGLPVYDIKMVSVGTFLVAAGNGTYSDGIYISQVAAIGEPGIRWSFKRIAFLSRPTALEVVRRDGDGTAKIYAGNTTGVYQGLLCNDTIIELTILPSPQNPFGTQCASLVYHSEENLLYAAGNYDYRIFYETGLRDTAQFLRGLGELATIKKIDVTSMINYPYQNDTLIAIATNDSGIQVFKNAERYTAYPSPKSGEPVLSIIPFAYPFSPIPFVNSSSAGEVAFLSFAAATPSGIYFQCGPDMNCLWTSAEYHMPPTPTCLAQTGAMLWAGTDSGVYQFELYYETSTISSQRRHNDNVEAFYQQRNGFVFRHSVANPEDYTVSIFDLQGKCIQRNAGLHQNSNINKSVTGTLLYRINNNNRVVTTGTVTVY